MIVIASAMTGAAASASSTDIAEYNELKRDDFLVNLLGGETSAPDAAEDMYTCENLFAKEALKRYTLVGHSQGKLSW